MNLPLASARAGLSIQELTFELGLQCQNSALLSSCPSVDPCLSIWFVPGHVSDVAKSWPTQDICFSSMSLQAAPVYHHAAVVETTLWDPALPGYQVQRSNASLQLDLVTISR